MKSQAKNSFEKYFERVLKSDPKGNLNEDQLKIKRKYDQFNYLLDIAKSFWEK